MEQLAANICFFQVSSKLLAFVSFVQHRLIVILEALENIRNCQLLCVTAACVQNRSTMLLFKVLTTDTDSDTCTVTFSLSPLRF